MSFYLQIFLLIVLLGLLFVLLGLLFLQGGVQNEA